MAETRQATEVPPGPATAQPITAMREAPLRFLTEMWRAYGDVTRHEAEGDSVYMLFRPDLARHVLRDNSANYTKERTPDDTMLRPLLGNGLLTSDGEDWARQRRMCAPAFRRTEVEPFAALITSAAAGLRDAWRAAGADGTAVRVDHGLSSLTLTVIAHAMLGTDLAGIGDGFGQAVDAVNGYVGHYVTADHEMYDATDTARRRAGYQRAKAFLDLMVGAMIAARRAGGGAAGRNLLDTLLAADGELPPGELRDQVLTVVMAGHETTAKALTWTLYLLDQNQAEQAAVRGEVDRVLGGRLPTAADLPNLPACRRAVEEAMRLFPPLWLISRRAVGRDVIDGYHVPPGALVCVSPYVLHRDPRYWEAPEEYRPERFTATASAARPSHLYLPFGGGQRVCVGQHLAMVEAVLVLAVLVQELALELVPGFPVEPEALVTLRPRHGMAMTVRPRRQRPR
jgi:enediyne biosynthesis protein E7